MSTTSHGDGQNGPAVLYTAVGAAAVREPASPVLAAPVVFAPRRPAYTLFVDENGHATLKNLDHRDNRFLSLTGVACAIEHEQRTVLVEMDDLKLQHFGTQNVVLHCEDIKRAKKGFEVLGPVPDRQRFDRALLRMFETWEYTVFSALLDKQKLVDAYGRTRYDAYHYALEVLLDGYVVWLEGRDGLGDVLAESRGGTDDLRLKAAFRRLWHDGTGHLDPDRVQARLTSPEIKIRRKAPGLAGLQLTDLLAHPSFASMRATVEGAEMQSVFGRQVVAILDASKYHAVDGVVDGNGRRWLP